MEQEMQEMKEGLIVIVCRIHKLPHECYSFMTKEFGHIKAGESPVLVTLSYNDSETEKNKKRTFAQKAFKEFVTCPSCVLRSVEVWYPKED